MHDFIILHPSTHLLQQKMMPDVVEVFTQINIHHSCQALQYPPGYSVYRLMGMTFWPVPVGAAYANYQIMS